jgi:hypothetical protein
MLINICKAYLRFPILVLDFGVTSKQNKMKLKAVKSLMIVSCLIFSVLASLQAQNVGISSNGATPNSNAMLDVVSPSSGQGKGLLIPRITYDQRTLANESGGLLNASGNLHGGAAQGLMVYQTNSGGNGEGFYYNKSTTSTPEWVYVANSNENLRSNYVVVNELSDFPSPVSGVITLADYTTYELNGNVNVGTNTIAIGSASAILGKNKFVDAITYTGTASLFNISNKSAVFRSFSVYSTTAGSKVFSASGTSNLVQVFDIMFTNCKSIGEFDGGFGVNINNCAVQGCADGFTFKGTLAHLFYNNNKHCSNTGKIVQIPSGTFASVQIQNNYFEIDENDTGLYMQASSATVSDAKIVNNFFHGDGDYIAGVTTEYNEWFFYGNTELEDSDPYGLIIFDSNTVTTSIPSKNTYYKVSGTNYTSSFVQFDTNSVNNRLRYKGTKSISADITVNGSLLANMTNKHIYVAVRKNGSSIVAYTKLKASSTSDVENFSFTGNCTLSTNDYLEVCFQTSSKAFDVRMVDMQFKIED